MAKKAQQIPWAYRGKPLGPPPRVEYNPMMGSRLDLDVKTGDETDNAKWVVQRRAYLTALLAARPSAYARGCYERELATLVDKKSERA